MTTPDLTPLELERLLFRYSMALERGDFDAITAILQIAADNTALNRMIQELDAEYALEPTTDPSFTGDSTMAQMTYPRLRPQKQKQGLQPRRSSLLFPFAAVIALILGGFSIFSFNQPPVTPLNQGVPGVSTATSTAMPPTAVPLYTNTPTPIPLTGQVSETPTPVPFNPNDMPTLIPSGEWTPTSTPFTGLDIMQPPTLVPLSGTPDAVVLIYCEGITRGDPETSLFAHPFADEATDEVIGTFGPNLLMPINDVVLNVRSGETWYYIGEANDGDDIDLQGWTRSTSIELMRNCDQGPDKVWLTNQITTLFHTLNPEILPSATMPPTVVPPTLIPPFEFTPTATPLS